MRITMCEFGCVGCINRKKKVDKCTADIKDLPIEILDRLYKEVKKLWEQAK